MNTEVKIPDHTDETTMTVVGDYVIFASIDHDQDGENPCESWDGFGSIRSLSSRHINSIDRDEAVEILENDPDAVALSYYEHGGCLWFVQNSVAPAGVEFQWDGVRFAGLWVPDESVRESYGGQDGLTRREWMVKQAECACETYTQWVNGEVYGYTVKAYKARKDEGDDWIYDDLDDYRRDYEISEDSCWGFYGFETVAGECKAAIENAIEHINAL